MGKPTIREILTDFDITDPKHELLAERVEAVLKLHVPFGIYDECGHEHTDADVIAGTAVDVPEVGVTCEEGKLYDVCRECHLVNDEPTEDCADCKPWPCATIRALEGEQP